MIDREEAEMRMAEIQEQMRGSGLEQVRQASESMQLAEKEKSLLREQIDLGDELFVIENLLRGKVLREENGVTDWKVPDNPEQIVLSEYGVHLIMNTIQFYLNKNLLLSNYEDYVILNKMEDFSTALADAVFMEYENIFKYPTLDECKEKLLKRIERKTELREFTYKLIGIKKDKQEIKEEFIKQIEDRIEDELDKIKEQLMKNKLKRFELIIRVLQDFVHSAYLRAWNGQERRTIRQHINVTETISPNQLNMIKPQKEKRRWF